MKIKNLFIDFFKSKNHEHLPSSGLIPINDASLMFTNSGMVQFKNIFLGNEVPKHLRVVTAQQCIRAGGKHNDLDNVGYTRRHHTFFEMLGNFSFGNYFKEEAISYAWELITSVVDKNRLYVTVYHTDEEAYKIWTKYISKDRIIKISTNDNFWSMGSRGPCGACSEIFYDCGPEIPGGLPGSENADGDRFLELWNLVFMEFDLQEDGSKLPLTSKSIDTGAGLERLQSVIEEVYDNYETSLFSPLHVAIEHESGVSRARVNKHAFNVIADHMKTICALISQGVVPSNVGRGYVLRRIIRRAMRYANFLNRNELILNRLVKTTMTLLSEYVNRGDIETIEKILVAEQNKFYDLMKNGLAILEKQSGHLAGDIAFKLYDTYGFPLDMTEDYMKSKNGTVNVEEFNRLMNEQRQKSKWTGTVDNTSQFSTLLPTEFYGYTYDKLEASVIFISSKNEIVLNQTVFYGESGGQKGDIGYIYNDRFRAKVRNTVKYDKVIVHECEILSGDALLGDKVCCEIDREYRRGLAAHHSATHMLNYALRKVLGNGVIQQGSLVMTDRLRFDFNNNNALTNSEILAIEKIVNDIVLQNVNVEVSFCEKEEAFSKGITAVFTEKYDDEVRVVNIGDISIELCGGTHVARSGDVGSFYILKESSVASGIRRIEAVCAKAALEYCQENRVIISRLTETFSSGNILVKTEELINKNKALQKEIFNLNVQILKFSNLSQVNYLKTNADAAYIRSALKEQVNANNQLRYVYDTAKIIFVGGDISNLSLIQALKVKIISGMNYAEIVLLSIEERKAVLNYLGC